MLVVSKGVEKPKSWQEDGVGEEEKMAVGKGGVKFLISLFRVGSLGIIMKALLYCLGKPALLRMSRGGNCDTILLPTNRRPRDGTVVSTKT